MAVRWLKAALAACFPSPPSPVCWASYISLSLHFKLKLDNEERNGCKEGVLCNLVDNHFFLQVNKISFVLNGAREIRPYQSPVTTHNYSCFPRLLFESCFTSASPQSRPLAEVSYLSFMRVRHGVGEIISLKSSSSSLMKCRPFKGALCKQDPKGQVL